MIKPKIMHNLEVAYGTEYGFEEAEVLMDVLKNMAPSCGKRVKQFEDDLQISVGPNMRWQLHLLPQALHWQELLQGLNLVMKSLPHL